VIVSPPVKLRVFSNVAPVPRYWEAFCGAQGPQRFTSHRRGTSERHSCRVSDM